jgi:LPXTG-motif cell wall-anchored protein
LAGKTADVKTKATSTGAPAREQLQARATAAGGKVRDVTPEPVQRAARHAAARTSSRQVAIAAAGAVAVVIGFVLVRRRRRR